MADTPRPLPGDGDSDFEKYMRGEPLNDEIRAVASGNAEKVERTEWQAPTPTPKPERDLTMTERANLRALRAHPGWPVLMRLAEKVYLHRQRSVIAMSQVDPLENAASIGRQWGYLGQYKSAVNDLLMVAVTAEVERAREESDDDDVD